VYEMWKMEKDRLKVPKDCSCLRGPLVFEMREGPAFAIL